MPINEKAALIADIKRLMNPIKPVRSSYDSNLANKVVDKLLVRIGIIAIIGLLGYIIIKDSFHNKSCKC